MDTKSKTELRIALRQARMALPATEIRDRSLRVAARIRALVEQGTYSMIHCYEPIAGLHEVDVGLLLDFLKAQQTAVYTSRYLDGEWRIVSLSGQIPGKPPKFDCIIVPMLGFDARLHRLGMGGGYYDRLLSYQPQAFKIGACFELGRISELSSEAHDIPLDVIVTEAAVYHGQR